MLLKSGRVQSVMVTIFQHCFFLLLGAKRKGSEKPASKWVGFFFSFGKVILAVSSIEMDKKNAACSTSMICWSITEPIQFPLQFPYSFQPKQGNTKILCVHKSLECCSEIWPSPGIRQIPFLPEQPACMTMWFGLLSCWRPGPLGWESRAWQPESIPIPSRRRAAGSIPSLEASGDGNRLRPGHPTGELSSAGPMARQGMGCWRPALLGPGWGRGWWGWN